LFACMRDMSNDIIIEYPFLDTKNINKIAEEAAILGVDSHKTDATLTRGKRGVLHGSLSYLLQNSEGQVQPAYSISAGLDYPGIGPEHAYLRDSKRVEYHAINDRKAMEGVKVTSEQEGIIRAMETAHALAYLDALMPRTTKGEIVILNCSGRGDKDMDTIAEYL